MSHYLVSMFHHLVSTSYHLAAMSYHLVSRSYHLPTMSYYFVSMSYHFAAQLWRRLVTCGRLGVPSGPGLFIACANCKLAKPTQPIASLNRLIPVLLLATAAFAQVPTPESVLGYKPGDDFHLATYDDALAYFRKVAATSNRIKLVNVGKTTQGRDWWIAFISDPENLAQLDHYKEVSRRLALSRGISDEQAHALAHDIKPIIHIDGGLHANEVANHQHTIQLGYDLVASEQPEYKAIRQNLIVELWFSINPDGQNIGGQLVSPERRHAVRSQPAARAVPGICGPRQQPRRLHAEHDRDRAMVTKATLETQPLVFYTQHQTAPFPGRIYLPPFADPISGNMHPLMVRWLSLIGMTIARVSRRSRDARLHAPGDLRRLVSRLSR